MTDNPEQPITPEHAASAAHDIIGKLVAQWREGGLPLQALSEALIKEGLDQITGERGPAAAVAVLRQLMKRTEEQHLESVRRVVEEAMHDNSPTFP